MRDNEKIIKKILGVLAQQELTERKDMLIKDFYTKIDKRDFEKVNHILLREGRKLISMVAYPSKPEDDTIRINNTYGYDYLDNLEQRERDEKRDKIAENQTKFNKYILLTGSIIALVTVFNLIYPFLISWGQKQAIIG